MSLVTPAVLLIAFNRPAQTRQVFAAIRSARPARLYLACDGPRAGKAGEAEKVQQVRALAQEDMARLARLNGSCLRPAKGSS